MEKEIAELKEGKSNAEEMLEKTRADLDEVRRALEVEKSSRDELSEQIRKVSEEKSEAESRRIELVLKHGEECEAIREQYEAEKRQLDANLRQRIGELEDESGKLRKLSENVKMEFENQLESLKAMSIGEVEALKAEKYELEEKIDLVS